MIKYLGSKRALLAPILSTIGAECGPGSTVLDLFSGTARVGHALKRAGYRVIANDHNAYAHTLARCYVRADAQRVLDDAQRLVREFNALVSGASGGCGGSGGGYFTDTFCVRSRFFHPKNGERIDAVREAIARKGLEPDLEAVMLTSLMEAADRVDSTTGVQMAYLKQWAPRAHNDLELRVPDVLPAVASGPCEAHGLDAFEAAERFECDVAYIDPPYNQHSYLGNYHVWESLVRWDKPQVYGVACKRVDVRARPSVFNSRPRFRPAMARLLGLVRARALVVSFSDEGYLSRAEMEELLGALWGGMARVATIPLDYRRYVGAKIGIHNPRGEKVGTVSHTTNTEFLFVARRGAPVQTRSPSAVRSGSTASP